MSINKDEIKHILMVIDLQKCNNVSVPSRVHRKPSLTQLLRFYYTFPYLIYSVRHVPLAEFPVTSKLSVSSSRFLVASPRSTGDTRNSASFLVLQISNSLEY